jgi:CubicO group peptidase (beta-lactamase class C family)
MARRMMRWIVLVTMLGLIWPAAATTASMQDDADEYQDPEGRFSVPIPTGWTAEQADGYGVLTDPEGEIVISLLALDGIDLQAAIDEAWRIVEPGFATQPLQVAPIPPPSGADEALVITYDIGEVSGEVVQALAVLADGVCYVMLIRADIVAAQERASQINIIASGFTIIGTEEISIAGVAPRAIEGALVRELEAFIVETMDLLDVPGATIAVVQDGEVVYRQAFGVTRLGDGEPMTPETRMMIGSTTKPLTTMMLATLVDEGVIAWDTPVVEILPWFSLADPELTPRITVQDLVCACTGVSRRDLELMFNFDELTAEDIVASLAEFDLFTPIGEAFQYSNQMVATGGYTGGAAVHGEDADLYGAYVTEMNARVLGPIGMEHTTFAFEEVVAAGNFALPHGLTIDGAHVPIPLGMERWVGPIAPSGGLWSNVDDMALFLMTMLATGTAPDGTVVVSPENLAHTWAPQVPVAADIDYGLGWFIESYKGRNLMHHGGNTLGFTSDLAFMPDAGIGIVVLANGQATNLFNEAVRYRLLELVFDLEPEIEAQIRSILEGEAEAPSVETGAPTPAATPVVETGPVDPDAVAPYLGTWENEALGAVTLELEGGDLYLDAGEFRTVLREVPSGLERMSITLFITADPPLAGLPIELRIDPPGLAAMTIGEGAYLYSFVRSEAPAASPAATPAATPAAAD